MPVTFSLSGPLASPLRTLISRSRVRCFPAESKASWCDFTTAQELCPHQFPDQPGFAVESHVYGPISNRDVGFHRGRLGKLVLPHRNEAEGLPDVLLHKIRHRGDRQYLLSNSFAENRDRMGSQGPGGLPDRRESSPSHHT